MLVFASFAASVVPWLVGLLLLLVGAYLLSSLFPPQSSVGQLRMAVRRGWQRFRYDAIRLYKRASQLALLVARFVLHLTHRLHTMRWRNLALLGLFILACFVPYILYPISTRLAALLQIFWSLGILGVGLSIALVHFLVEKELNAIANGLLGKERKRLSEVPTARYLHFQGLVEFWTLGVACVGMVFAFAFLAQGIHLLGLGGYRIVGQEPWLWTWMLYAWLSVFGAVDIFDTFATFQVTLSTIQHQGVITSTLVFVFKAIFDLLLIAKVKDWWSKRNLALDAIGALEHRETRKKAEETLRRCRKSAIPHLVAAFEHSNKVRVRCSALRLLQELSYARREALFLEALQSKEEEVRLEATKQLGKQNTVTALEGLRTALRDASSQVRAYAAEGLAMGDFASQAVPLLLEALRDPIATVREKAAGSLEALADPQSLEGLRAALQDKEGKVRKQAVAALARFRDEVLPSLAPMLKDPNKEVRLQVVTSFEEIIEEEREAVVSCLLQALGDEEEEVRVKVLEVLRWEEVRDTIPQLGSLLQSDRSSEVRRAAAQTLGAMGTKKAVAPLLEALDDPHYQVRCDVLEALGDLRATDAIPRLLGFLKDGDRDVRRQAIATLGELDQAQPEVLEDLAGVLDDTDVELRVAAVEALALLTLGKAEALRKGFEDADASVREATIHGLYTPLPAAFLELLLERIQDPSETRDVKKAAIATLSYYDTEVWEEIDAQARGPLVERLADDDLEIAKAAIEAIGMLHFADAHTLLLPCLQSDVSEIRQTAAEALAYTDHDEARDALVHALLDGNLQVRAAAAEALWEHAEKADLKAYTAALLVALQNDEKEVQQHVALILAQIHTDEAMQSLTQALLAENAEVRAAAAEALGIFHAAQDDKNARLTPISEALRDALRDKEEDVRMAAAEALGKTANGDHVDNVEVLLYALRRDVSENVRMTAASALGELKAQEAITVLQQALQQDPDEWVRASAAEVLGTLANTEAIPTLLDALREDRDAWVRQNAIKALKTFDDPTANKAMGQALLTEKNIDVRKDLIKTFQDLHLTDQRDVLRQALSLEKEEKLRRLIQKTLRELDT